MDPDRLKASASEILIELDMGPLILGVVVLNHESEGHSRWLPSLHNYLWVPSLKAVFGGVLIFSGVHVWTADTEGADQRAAWRANLDAKVATGEMKWG